MGKGSPGETPGDGLENTSGKRVNIRSKSFKNSKTLKTLKTFAIEQVDDNI